MRNYRTTGLADACKIFMDLEDELLLQPHRDHIQHHFTKAMQQCHMVASWIQRTWTINKTRRVGCMLRLSLLLMLRLQHFLHSSSTEMAPLTWWQGLQKYKGLLDTMIQLHAACASIESIFNLWTLAQQTLKPTWCGQGSKLKLVLCYRMCRGHTNLGLSNSPL